MIAAVIERCAGIDVGKQFLRVCVMTGPGHGEAQSSIRTFGTTVGELQQARQWRLSEGCTHVLRESTGVYGKPVCNILEGHIPVALANPHEGPARKGHQTDPKDAWWRAHLLRHGMGTASFIPPRPPRQLRDLTRRRGKLVQAVSAEKNRVSKVLEDAHSKLGNVLTDVFEVSGQCLREALLDGRGDAEQVAHRARASAQKKIPALIAALEQHQMNAHHRQWIGFSLQHIGFLGEQLAAIDERMERKIPEAG